jgi:hypothetical protein
MYGVVRRYAEASALADALAQHEQAVRDLIASVPGFVAYYVVRSDGDLATITIFEDRDGAAESTRRIAAWLREQNLDAGLPPDIIVGEAFLHF